MKILCKIDQQANALVKQVGKYLYKHIDGAYKFENSANTYDVYMEIYYQIKEQAIKPADPPTLSEEVYTMKLDINITTYSNKLRFNIIELSDAETTIKHFTIAPDKFDSLPDLFLRVQDTVRTTLEKLFKDYEFMF